MQLAAFYSKPVHTNKVCGQTMVEESCDGKAPISPQFTTPLTLGCVLPSPFTIEMQAGP